MLAVSRERAQIMKQHWGLKEVSPERNKVWVEPKLSSTERRRKVAVVYYLSRNGKLEQPHFMEVSLSSNEGLFLRDVIKKLNVVRGRAVPKMYSWSSKRSYKNGFVWHDLCEDDFIYPVRGNEYVLKGTEILNFSTSSLSFHSSTSSSSTTSSENKHRNVQRAVRDDAVLALARRKKADFNEIKAYKSKSKSCEFTFNSADASTQTESKMYRRQRKKEFVNNIDSSSSLKSLKTVSVKPDAEYQAVGSCSSARMRASALLMHLLSCTSGCETKDERLKTVSSHYSNKSRASRPATNHENKIFEDAPSFRSVGIEDKQYNSGSIVENRDLNGGFVDEDLQSLKRSSSFNASRNSKLGHLAKDVRVHSESMPRISNAVSDENHFVSLSCLRHGLKMANSEQSSN